MSSTTTEKAQELALISPALSVIKLQRCSTVLFHFYEIVFTSSVTAVFSETHEKF